MADSRNRTIVSVLDDADGTLELSDLAEALVSSEVTLAEADEYEQAVERTILSLHHTHLPQLDDAGLVEYHQGERTVASADRLDSEWRDGTALDGLLEWFGRGADADAVGTIEGRPAAIERGRQLADWADDELFLVYTAPDLLGDECLRRARAALDRDVDIILGSRDPEVRALVRRRLPEVTVWEPQFDWTTSPGSYPTVGRLVLADRERVMLAVLDGPAAEGPERALLARGRDTPLVVLVRELLGSRLDHLDYQSADFRQQLPF